ncbi:lycopene beta-cyclase [Sinorhizobium medicae]|nr:lycopene beta-cyclase [Sinorhizobium medicae]
MVDPLAPETASTGKTGTAAIAGRDLARAGDRERLESESIDPSLPVVLVGAGLASAIIAQRLSTVRDAPQIVILEGTDTPFGENTWSFHKADLQPSSLGWIAALIAHQWDGQSVRFGGYERHLPSGYASLTSASVRDAIERMPNVTLNKNTEVTALSTAQVTFANGSTQAASCVIDCRGYRPSSSMVLGYQKFVGLEAELSEPHGLPHPVIMDATVDQLDGYRFVYLLPLSPTRVLIEDTRYSEGADLDHAVISDDIHAYATRQGWDITQVVRTEDGVLPIVLAHDFERFWSELPEDIAHAGLRAGLFHPTTGYSLPDAVHVAEIIAENWPICSAALAHAIRGHAARQHKKQGFYRLLNRMLFLAAQPDRRHLVLERFYNLPTPLIERFYAGRTTTTDILRILTGKPPVPIHRALACLNEAHLFENGSS